MSASLPSTRDAAYLAFVRSRPCVVTGACEEAGSDIVAHHVRCLGGGGVGLKPSDYLTVPLTAYEHVQLHNVGERSYWKAKGVDPGKMIAMTMLTWLAFKRVPYVDLVRFWESLDK